MATEKRITTQTSVSLDKPTVARMVDGRSSASTVRSREIRKLKHEVRKLRKHAEFNEKLLLATLTARQAPSAMPEPSEHPVNRSVAIPAAATPLAPEPALLSA